MKSFLVVLFVMIFSYTPAQVKGIEEGSDSLFIPVYHPVRDTVKVIILYTDTSHINGFAGPAYGYHALWDYAYSVKEKHNTAEWLIDPGACGNCNYHDYWKHLLYLDINKKPFNRFIIIWDSKDL